MELDMDDVHLTMIDGVNPQVSMKSVGTRKG